MPQPNLSANRKRATQSPQALRPPKKLKKSLPAEPTASLLEIPLELLDLDLVLEDNVWLSSSHIMAALMNIKQQYPSHGGLSDTLLLHDKTDFNLKIIPNKTIFVLHVFNHWVVVTNMKLSHGCYRGVWHLYDSLGDVMYFNKALRILNQICQRNVRLQQIDCQHQRGFNDCGLFSIANVLSLVNRICPSFQEYDQNKMRDHYNFCLQIGKFSCFP